MTKHAKHVVKLWLLKNNRLLLQWHFDTQKKFCYFENIDLCFVNTQHIQFHIIFTHETVDASYFYRFLWHFKQLKQDKKNPIENCPRKLRVMWKKRQWKAIDSFRLIIIDIWHFSRVHFYKLLIIKSSNESDARIENVHWAVM